MNSSVPHAFTCIRVCNACEPAVLHFLTIRRIELPIRFSAKGSPQSLDSVVGEIGEGHGGQLSGTAAAKDTAGCYSIGNQSIE
jgi:hypothetical protein